MKFSCGETEEAFLARVGKWRRWFAWRPIEVGVIDGRIECRWLEYIEIRFDGYRWNARAISEPVPPPQSFHGPGTQC